MKNLYLFILLFFPLIANAGSNKQGLVYAGRAAMIASGIDQQVNSIKGAAEKRAIDIAQYYNIQKEAGAILFITNSIREKSVQFNWNDSAQVIVSPKMISLSIQF